MITHQKDGNKFMFAFKADKGMGLGRILIDMLNFAFWKSLVKIVPDLLISQWIRYKQF